MALIAKIDSADSQHMTGADTPAYAAAAPTTIATAAATHAQVLLMAKRRAPEGGAVGVAGGASSPSTWAS